MKLNHDISFDDLLTKFFFFKQLRPATIDSYQKAVRRWLAMYPKSKSIDVNIEAILNWRSCILYHHIKSVTWNSYVRHLKALFAFAIEHKLLRIKQNPFSKMFVKAGKAKRKVFTERELARIDHFINGEVYRILPDILQPLWFCRVLVLAFRYTAMRRFQLLALKIENIELQHKTIFIEGQTNKNHDDHIIPISKEAANKSIM